MAMSDLMLLFIVLYVFYDIIICVHMPWFGISFPFVGFAECSGESSDIAWYDGYK